MAGSIKPLPGSIICGVDGSASAKGAIRVARHLSRLLERRLVFVHVVEPGTSNEEIEAITERLQELAARTPGSNRTRVLWLLDVGHPADRLVAAAEDEQASMIVVGSNGPRSSLLGSVSAEVSRRAPCAVVVAPPGVNAMANGHRMAPNANGDGFALGATGSGTEFVGGIARFNLGAVPEAARA